MKHKNSKHKRLEFSPINEQCVLDSSIMEEITEVNSDLDNALYFDYEEPQDTVYTSEPIEITLHEDEWGTEFDLGDLYPAGDLLSQMGMLTFDIVENSAPEAISPVLDGNLFILNRVGEEGGSVDLTVRGVFLDGRIYNASFRINLITKVCRFTQPELPSIDPNPIQNFLLWDQERKKKRSIS